MGLIDDIPALNKEFRLAGDRFLVPFSPIHLKMMQLARFEQSYLDNIPNYEAVLAGYSEIGYAYTGVVAGKPVCCWGAIVMWPGVAEMWLVPDMSIRRYAFTFHRASKRWIDILMSELQLVRLQATVHTGNARADKWIRSLYLEKEGILRSFGPDGADYAMYSRLSNVGSVQLSESSTSPTGA